MYHIPSGKVKESKRAKRGELDLDKSVVEYLPYPRLTGDELYKKITAIYTCNL
jgi:hypothetical protein